MWSWGIIALLCGPAFAASDSVPSRLSIGANVVGGQIGYNFADDWRGELRRLIGKQSADAGKIKSDVTGARGYRLFETGKTRFYFGVEADYITARQENSSYRSTGAAAGGFVGVERRLTRRIWLGVDAGPYYLSMKESTTHQTDKGVEFVLNSAVMFYLF